MRNDATLLLDILTAAHRIQRFMHGLSQLEFEADDRTQAAVIRELMVIGEATRLLSDETKARYPDMDWRGIRDMRNALVHVYFAVDLNVLWDTIQDDVPVLIQQLEPLIPPDRDEDVPLT